MNSEVNSFRQTIRGFRHEHPIFLRRDPFWTDCVRGRLTTEDLQLWALDFYPAVRDFPQLYAHVAARCESEQAMTFLAETLFEETGGGVETESHPTLFRAFLKGLGVSLGELPAACHTGAGQAIHELCWKTVREGSFLEGLTLLGIGIERPLPEFFQLLARTLQRHYGLDDVAVKFFNVHTVADVKHSQIASRIVSELAQTASQRERVRELVFYLWDLEVKRMDELYARVQRRRAAENPAREVIAT